MTIVICMCTFRLITCILYCCRSSSFNYSNPLFNTASPEHLYDDVSENQEMEAKNKRPPNDALSSASKGSDCDTVHSNQVKFDESSVYYNVDAKEMDTMHYDIPRTPAKPKDAENSIAMFAAEDHHHLPNTESPTEQDDYLLPDIPFVVENQYASQDETQRNENHQYTQLIASQQTQPVVYQKLVGQQPPPSS